MRKSLALGLTTAISTVAIAAPAMAQAPAPAPAPTAPAVISPAQPAAPAAQNAANAPQVHIDTIKVQKSKHGYVIATVPLYSINMGDQTVYVTITSSMKTFQPATGGPFSGTSGKIGFPGNGKVLNTYSMRFAYQHKTVAQVRKQLKVTISNPTNGGVITNATATASA